jgi:putative addiction module CopG family antidote
VAYTADMKVELSEQAEELVNQQIADGRYESPGEVVEDALRRLADEAEYWAEVERMVRAGLRSLDEGRSVELSPDLAGRVINEGRAKREAERSRSA